MPPSECEDSAQRQHHLSYRNVAGKENEENGQNSQWAEAPQLHGEAITRGAGRGFIRTKNLLRKLCLALFHHELGNVIRIVCPRTISSCRIKDKQNPWHLVVA